MLFQTKCSNMSETVACLALNENICNKRVVTNLLIVNFCTKEVVPIVTFCLSHLKRENNMTLALNDLRRVFHFHFSD